MTRTIFFAAAIAFAAGAVSLARAQQGEDADFKKEERFHRIYKTYNEQPTSNEAWEKALANRKANTYPIQQNDTLWDVSNTFFGDSNYWPKIWSYNTDNILNPHEISPKNVIKFYPGTLAEAPTIGLADANAAPEAMPNKIIEKTPEGGVEGIQIPPPKRTSRPLVKNLPPSLPLYRLGRVNSPPVQFESDTLLRKIPVLIKNLSRYVTDAPVNSVGEVVEVELASGKTAADYQYIVVRLSDAGQKKLVAFKDETTVSDIFGNNGRGTVVQVLGEIEVLEKVSDSENLYRAMVQRIVDPVEIGSKLMVGKIQTFNADKTTLTSSLQTKIIGGENHRYTHNMFSDDTIVFLNAGSKQGLQLNSTLPIFKSERLRNSATKSTINDRAVGTLKVVNVASNFSTAYIVATTSELMVGDYVGGRVGATATASQPGAETIDSETEVQSGEPFTDETPENSEAPDDGELQLKKPPR